MFGGVSITKKSDINKYKYSGYEIGFHRHGVFCHPSGGTGRNVIIFWVDMSSSKTVEHTLAAEKNVFN